MMNDNSRIIALIPARLDSTRLPRKQLRPIGDHAMLWYLVERMDAVDMIDDVVVATTDRAVDDPLVEWARRRDTTVFRGVHEDVLKRFHTAATEFEADIVVRANGDNPLLSPLVTHNGIQALQTRNLDFVTGKSSYTDLPVGIGPEILRTETLEDLISATEDSSHREHVTSYIFDHPDAFSWGSIPVETDWKAAELSATVDTEADLSYVRAVVENLPNCNPDDWCVEEIIDACHQLTANDTDD